MHKSIAEFIGTFALVLFGCGAAAIGGMGTGPTAIDVLGMATMSDAKRRRNPGPMPLWARCPA
jgi:glycerol uptake facilitator-like aquaporin